MTALTLLASRSPCLLLLVSSICAAGEADVTDTAVNCDSSRVCTFSVTVRHEDTGWDHYADHWRVLDPDGNELGKRILLHPHVSEQPFTRSLSGVQVPSDIKHVTIEAHDKVHEYGGTQLEVSVP